MRRRDFVSSLAFSGLVSRVAPTLLVAACGAREERGGGGRAATLRVIHTGSLTSLDPIWTTAPGAREYGFLVFDQLVAVDNSYKPQPQMADWAVEDEGRAYLFTLRDGLTFHDGHPVRSADCIASIKRWAARDGFGQLLMPQVLGFDVVDDRRFRIRLKAAFPLLPAALGKSSAPACLIMPERMANTDPARQVTESVGSGPFRFLKNEWVPGSKAAFERFDGYRPRPEPANGLAGGKHANVKRVEWAQITDPSTAMSALQEAEQDYWDFPPADLLATLGADPGLALGERVTTPAYYMLQPNHQQPPFNNPAIRQAVAMGVDQLAIMRGVSGGQARDAHAARSVYSVGSPFYTEAGSGVIAVADPAKAKQALAAAGYKGEKIVLLAGSEGAAASIGQIVEDLLRRIGMNVALTTLDFASLIQRRTNHGPIDAGGWNLFVTGWVGTDILDPVVHPMLRGAGLKGYPGWCEDPRIEALRQQWVLAPEAKQKEIAEQIQLAAFKSLPFIPLGGVTSHAVWRKGVTGVLKAPYGVYWNIGRS